MTQKPESIPAYIGILPVEHQTVAERRQAIRTAAPQCVEDIAYGMPTFRIDVLSLIVRFPLNAPILYELIADIVASQLSRLGAT
jgi:uncharacterized protein YdhG (YjbR/CyaY superfamily)